MERGQKLVWKMEKRSEPGLTSIEMSITIKVRPARVSSPTPPWSSFCSGVAFRYQSRLK